MPNPTTQSPSQFTAPFNILPDILFPNVTNLAVNQAQFVGPFNILPDPVMKNPTNSAQSKIQFKRPFNILPDTIFTNPTTANGSEVLPGLGGLYYRRPQDGFGIVYSADSALVNQEKINEVGNVDIINWTPSQYVHTNVNLNTTINNVLGLASLAAGSLMGIPQIGQVGAALINGFDDTLSGTYRTLPLNKLTNKLFPNSNINTPVLYPDFRSKLNISLDSEVGVGNQLLSYAQSVRLDGFSAAFRGSIKAGIYSAAAATPIGPYSLFNLDGLGTSGYGWGEHDNRFASRKDFTMRSHVAKKWQPGIRADRLDSPVADAAAGKFARTINPIELATPFRGDKVNVIDFGKRRLNDAYLWNPDRIFSAESILGVNLNPLGITQDFIKFYMTGPKLQAGNLLDQDDILVFRAVLTGLDDSFTANWSPVQMIGRADPNYVYTSYGRDMSISFTVYATDRDEMQPIYRKLNALAGYTAPTYNPDSIAMEGPWMRLTVGDLLVQQPVVLTSVSYTYDVGDAPWEINIENDPNMMQVPFKVSVQMQFNVISDYLPQKGGRFYTLAKRFAGDEAQPITGDDNWLSDTKGNLNILDAVKRFKVSRTKIKNRLRGNPEI
jgi:hypothetical protein